MLYGSSEYLHNATLTYFPLLLQFTFFVMLQRIFFTKFLLFKTYFMYIYFILLNCQLTDQHIESIPAWFLEFFYS